MDFVLTSKKATDKEEFINFWSRFYIDPNKAKYAQNINVNFNKDTLFALFEWKNGSKLSDRKKTSFEDKILSKLKIINLLKASSDFKLDEFLGEFREVSVIWKIFLLHIIKPNQYPIFDQHVYRAFYFIKYSKTRELPGNNERKEEIYFNEYLPFFKQIKGNNTIKKVDEALWSFGKFLKTNYRKMIVE